MTDLKEGFRNWLIGRGLSNSTIYDYLITINRICRRERSTSEDLAINLFCVISNYQNKSKTVLKQYNAFLFETEQSREIMQQRHKNLLCAYSKLSAEEDKQYITTQELANILGVDVRQIKRWRENRITLHQEDQIEENPHGLKKIGPKFVQVGGLYRYYKDDLEKYFHRSIEKM